MPIYKTDFYLAYPTLTEVKAKVQGKKRNLSDELYLLKNLIHSELDPYEKKRLYKIAVHIYDERHEKPTFCNQIASLIYNLFCGRWGTTEFFFNKIKEEGKQHHLSKLKTPQPIPSKASTPSVASKSSTGSASSNPQTFAAKYGQLTGMDLREKAKTEIKELFDNPYPSDKELQEMEWFFLNFDYYQVGDLVQGLFHDQPKNHVFMNCLMAIQACPVKQQQTCMTRLTFRLYESGKIANYFNFSDYVDAKDAKKQQAVNDYIIFYIEEAIACSYGDPDAVESRLKDLYNKDPNRLLKVIEDHFLNSSSHWLNIWIKGNAPHLLKKDSSKVSSSSSSASSASKTFQEEFAEKYGSLKGDALKVAAQKEIADYFDKTILVGDDLQQIEWFFQNFDKKQMKDLVEGLFKNQTRVECFVNFITGMQCCSEQVQREIVQSFLETQSFPGQLPSYLDFESKIVNDEQGIAADNFIINYMKVSLNWKVPAATYAYLDYLYKANSFRMLHVIEEHFASLSSSQLLMDWLKQVAPAVLQRNSLDIKFVHSKRAVELAQSMKQDLSKLAEWLSYLYEVDSFLDSYFAQNFQAIMKTLTPIEIAGLAKLKFFKLGDKSKPFKIRLIFDCLNKEQIEALEDELVTEDVDLGTIAHIILGLGFKDVDQDHFIDLLSEEVLGALFTKITPDLITMNLNATAAKQDFSFALRKFITSYFQRAVALKDDRAKMLLKVFKEKSPLVFDSYYKQINPKVQAIIDSLVDKKV